MMTTRSRPSISGRHVFRLNRTSRRSLQNLPTLRVPNKQKLPGRPRPRLHNIEKYLDKKSPNSFELGDFLFSLSPLQHIIRHLIEPQADNLACRVASHGDAIDHIRGLNRVAVVSNDDELRILAQVNK